jgi:hypothetical protein
MRHVAVSRAERRSPAGSYSDMSVFLFIGGVTAVAGGSLAALYYLVGPSPRADDNEPKRRPLKKQLLSQWR